MEEKLVLSELECPVCLLVPRCSPIYQCGNGHLVCKECRPRLVKCPTCQIEYTQATRSIFAEKILETVEKRCRYELDGCDFKSRNSDHLLEHEGDCTCRPSDPVQVEEDRNFAQEEERNPAQELDGNVVQEAEVNNRLQWIRCFNCFVNVIAMAIVYYYFHAGTMGRIPFGAGLVAALIYTIVRSIPVPNHIQLTVHDWIFWAPISYYYTGIVGLFLLLIWFSIEFIPVQNQAKRKLKGVFFWAPIFYYYGGLVGLFFVLFRFGTVLHDLMNPN